MTQDHILGWHERLQSPGPALRSTPVIVPDTSKEDFEQGDHQSEAKTDEPDLPEGVWDAGPGVFKATCRSCERDYELCYDPQDFHEDTNYCGGSERCLP